MSSTMTETQTQPSLAWRDYLELCKPRVVLLMLLTVVVGMYLAAPGWVPVSLMLAALTGVGCAAASAAAVNHLVDRRIDAMMKRTCKRPIARGSVTTRNAFGFAVVMGGLGLFILFHFVNALTAVLTFLTVIGYAGVYTGYLKRATPQNIVIGGLAGAAPPLLGWTAVTNQLNAEALLLVLIIFTWTPPHFWSLAIYRLDEYKHAGIPMLPVTHGIGFTKWHVVLYTVLLLVASLLPCVIGMSGFLYGLAALSLGARFLYWSLRLYREENLKTAMCTFRFSIVYLLLIFVFLLLDHWMYGHGII